MNKTFALALTGVLSMSLYCQADPVPRALPPAPDDQNAYRPQVQPKPLPPDGYVPGQPLPPGGAAGQPQQPQGPSLEDVFLQAYTTHHSPRIMVWVNRTIQGDPLPKDGLEELTRTEEKMGTAMKTTSVKTKAAKTDEIGASPEDYSMIEASLVKYLDESGKVQIQDGDAARAKLDRAQVLRVENGDPAAARLLSTELQQDVLIKVTATPTRHAQFGAAVRLVAKAVSTADGRNLGTAFVDMPLPMSKTNINIFTGHLTEELMKGMVQKWMDVSPIEVRIYKTAGVDDALRIKKWLQATKGVQNVDTRAATGGEKTSYAAFMVKYAGAPEDLYADLKDAIGASQGLKAVDVQNNMIDLEVTGKLDLVTTTRKSETITTTTTTNTEEKKIEPINPAPPVTEVPAAPTPAPQ